MHTPGPWSARVGGGVSVFGPARAESDGSTEIARLNLAFDESITLANARLIASSPQLVEALQEARLWVLGSRRDGDHILQVIDAALTLATDAT